MNAIRLSGGSASSSFRHASSPPAEEPTATIGNAFRPAAEMELLIQRVRGASPPCGRLPGMKVFFFANQRLVEAARRHISGFVRRGETKRLGASE